MEIKGFMIKEDMVKHDQNILGMVIGLLAHHHVSEMLSIGIQKLVKFTFWQVVGINVKK